MVETLVADLYLSARRALRNWGISLTVIASIVIAVAANAAAFGWVQVIIANPLPTVPANDRLVVLASQAKSAQVTAVSYADYLSYRDGVPAFAGLTAFQERQVSMESSGHPQRAWAMFVTGNFFDVLRLRPLRGGFFRPDQMVDTLNGQAVAVISYEFWRDRLNLDPGIVGRRVVLNGQPFTIAGVAPRGFEGTITGLSYDLWLPLLQQDRLTGGDGSWVTDRKFRALHTLARLADGKSIQQAQADVAVAAARLATAYPEQDLGMGAVVTSLAHAPYGAQSLLATTLDLLLLASFIVLLIVCANLSNLLMLSYSGRDREFAIRTALGANSRRILVQMIVEAALLAGVASALGLLLTRLLLGLLRLFVPELALPVALRPELSWREAIYCLVMTVLIVTVASAPPILRAIRIAIAAVLQGAGRGMSAGKGQQRLRAILVGCQVALAFVTLVGAALFVIGFVRLARVDPGFTARNVLLFALAPADPRTRVADIDAFVDRARERLLGNGATRAVAYADYVPLGLSGGSWEDLKVEGYTPGIDESMKIYRSLVSADYFATLRIPVLDGREFGPQDTRQSPPVALVNRTFATRYFAGRNPLGRRIIGWGRPLMVVGVVQDSKYETPTEAPRPYFYVPYRQVAQPDTDLIVYVAATGGSPALVSEVHDEIANVGSAAYVSWSMTLQSYIGAAVFKNRLAMMLLSGLGIAALVLAAVGMYGVLSNYVSQRTAEIGIRMALGATSAGIVRLMLIEGLRPVLVGVAAGVGISLALARLVSNLLYGVSPADPAIYALVALVLIGVAVLVCGVPALRAGRLDPAIALRVG